jgi:hypothetical protein
MNKRSSLNSMLTSNGIDLGGRVYAKVVDNFDTFTSYFTNLSLVFLFINNLTTH